MRSVSLLIYNPAANELEARAKDSASNWMTAVKALDDDVFLGAENSYNIFTVKKVTTGVRDEEGRLEVRSLPSSLCRYSFQGRGTVPFGRVCQCLS